MRLSLRFILPLIVVLGLLAYAVVPVVDRLTLRWFVRDIEMRATLVANTIAEPLLDQLDRLTPAKADNFFLRITQDERLYAVGYCANAHAPPLASKLFPADLHCSQLAAIAREPEYILRSSSGPLQVAVRPLERFGTPAGHLVLIHDLSFVERRSEETRRYIFLLFAGLAVVVSLVTVVIAQLSWRGWLLGMQALLRGEGLLRQPQGGVRTQREFLPIARDIRRLVRDLESDRRARHDSQAAWTAESLRTILHTELRGDDVIVVANREPYIHEHVGDALHVRRPASGLVTALEPIMRACSGTWIAHGSGSADRVTVDRHDHVDVPPDNPSYRLRRIWLSSEEEAGYYFGFANEGLWPLCHIAHVRPVFRSSDWAFYEAVNRKFAAAVAAEARTRAPIVLVQDYHFALLPQMVRELLPEATIITFWHIPWPNPESFSICPWREQIVAGLLGSSILGFHTQSHCNNFVDTVDRTLEARVDRETFDVSLGGHLTALRRYPISVEWPPPEDMVGMPVAECRRRVRQDNGLPGNHLLGIGVDRLDYTKGITERFRAIERLFELKPEWIGRFSFIQIAAPTRSSIDEYQSHEAQVRALATRINARFSPSGRAGPPPILLKIEHHEPSDVYRHYRAAELCFVSSLHDGMNLVAKEFIAARDDERGVLVLSQFTGAARELPEALVVNPYDADQCAAALHLALAMPVDEQRDRMRLMRRLVAEFNVYRWAGRMLQDAAIMRRRERLPDANVQPLAGGPAN